MSLYRSIETDIDEFITNEEYTQSTRPYRIFDSDTTELTISVNIGDILNIGISSGDIISHFPYDNGLYLITQNGIILKINSSQLEYNERVSNILLEVTVKKAGTMYKNGIVYNVSSFWYKKPMKHIFPLPSDATSDTEYTQFENNYQTIFTDFFDLLEYTQYDTSLTITHNGESSTLFTSLKWNYLNIWVYSFDLVAQDFIISDAFIFNEAPKFAAMNGYELKYLSKPHYTARITETLTIPGINITNRYSQYEKPTNEEKLVIFYQFSNQNKEITNPPNNIESNFFYRVL